MTTERGLAMTIEEIVAFVEETFPQALTFGVTIESLEPGRMTLRMPVGERNLRPGGTVSGPTLMTLADTGFYFLLLAHAGPIPLMVTTHLSIDFLTRPRPDADLCADVELLKLGHKLAVGRVTMRSDGSPDPVAHATLTYAIPPRHLR
ncbi:MAG: PaaI family thioesterase [Sandaracinaceae bacterium]